MLFRSVSDSSKAWDIFSKDPDQFDLVVTDNQMPVMNGLTLAEKILVLNPQTHILMCTGFGDDLTVNQAQKIGIKEIIYKPIIKEKMAFAIRRILDESLNESVV